MYQRRSGLLGDGPQLRADVQPLRLGQDEVLPGRGDDEAEVLVGAGGAIVAEFGGLDRDPAKVRRDVGDFAHGDGEAPVGPRLGRDVPETGGDRPEAVHQTSDGCVLDTHGLLVPRLDVLGVRQS